MRSLYTEDIVGTKPRLTIFDKGYYKAQHDQQIQRSSKKYQRNQQYEWFTPLPKPNKSTYQRDPYKNTIKLISEHTGVSQSMHFQSLLKKNDNNIDQNQSRRNYSLLSNSGVTSLNSKQSFNDLRNNPYYPHRIRDVNDQSNSTRFTGNRSWNYTPNSQINLPDPKSQYISKWAYK